MDVAVADHRMEEFQPDLPGPRPILVTSSKNAPSSDARSPSRVLAPSSDTLCS